MPRKRNKRAKKNRPSDLAGVESTARKFQSLLVQPEIWGYMRAGMFKGLREKLLKIDYNTIRNVVDKVPLVGAVIQTRVDQVKKYAHFAMEKGDTGYEFYLRDRTLAGKKKPADEKMFFQLADFLDQTGIEYDSQREDDFADYLDLITRETLTIDQIGTEVQRNRKGEVIAFWALDAATIKRVDPDLFEGGSLNEVGPNQVTKDTRFAQMVDFKITNTYTDEDLLFDYKNKRADLRFRGFGYSPVEMCIDVITTLLFGYNYLRDQLMRDRVPKGFIQVMGDVGRDQLDAIREYWYAAMSGAGGQWNIPIVPSGKDGVGIDWKNIQANNREMEYHKLMMFLSSTIGAVFGMDMAEMGIKTDDSKSLIGASVEPRIESSKNRGLGAILSFLEQHINKIIRKVNEDYKFRFVGVDREDETKLAELRKTNVEAYLTVNEIRKAEGEEPLKDDYADVVLNPQAVQIYNAAKMAEQQAEMGGEPGEEGEEGGFGEGEEGAPGEGEQEPEGAEVDWESMFAKSLKDGDDVKVFIE